MGPYAASTVIAVIGTALLLPVAMLPILARVTRRYGGLRGWPLVAGAGLLGSAVALAAFTVFPLPDPGTLECTGEPVSTYWQTDWFASIGLVGDAWASLGFPAVLTSAAFLQVALNVLLFVPFGFFLHQVTRWTGLTVVVFGACMSAAIEITQGTGVFGLYPCPYRLLDVDDLIVNTLGVGIGVLISYALAGASWTHPRRSADRDLPTVPRRVIAAAIDVGLLFFVWAAAKAAWLLVLMLQQPDADITDLTARLPADWLFGAGAGLLLMVIVPWLRHDRATAGQVVLNIAPSRGVEMVEQTGRGAVLVRALVRWAPIVAFGAPALLAVAVVDLVLVLARADRRSLAGLASRTTTRTVPAIVAGVPGVAPRPVERA